MQWRRALGAAAAALLLLGAGEAAASCQVCSDERVFWSLWNSQVGDGSAESENRQYRGHWACSTARILSCDQQSSHCWLDEIISTTVVATQALLEAVPPLVACGGTSKADCSGGAGLGGPITAAFLAAILITLTIRSAKAFLTSEPQTGMLTTITLLIVLVVVVALLGRGAAEDLWRMAGVVVAFASDVGLQIRDGVGQTSPAAEGCPIATVADPREAGWPQAMAGMEGLVREMLDVAAIMVGVGMSFIPDLHSVIGGGMWSAVWKLLSQREFGFVVELLRLPIAIFIILYGLRIIASYAILILDAVVTLGVAVALSPVAVWLAFWKGTRGALGWCAGSLLYTGVLFVAAGVTVAAAKLIMTLGLRTFMALAYNRDYATAWPGAGWTKAGQCYATPEGFRGAPLNLYQDFAHHLCLISAPVHEGSQYGSWLVMDAAQAFTHWLPGALVLLASGAVTVAVLRYTQSAATEISGRSMQTGAVEAAGGASARLLRG